MHIVEVNLKDVQSDQDIFDRFNSVFGFPDYFGNNWDAFNDCMTRLDTDSKLVANINPVPDHVHLVIKNYSYAQVLDKNVQGNFGVYNGLNVFKTILIDITDNHPDWHGVGPTVKLKVTFEVHHGDY